MANSQIVHFPGGDPSGGRILGRTVDGKPEEGTLQVKSPFGIAIDLQDRILITNSGSDTVTRFPASNPANAEEIKVGFSPHAIAIDSQGNAWVGNLIGHPAEREKLDLVKQTIKAKLEARKGTMSGSATAGTTRIRASARSPKKQSQPGFRATPSWSSSERRNPSKHQLSEDRLGRNKAPGHRIA
jgi:hypothetical protein